MKKQRYTEEQIIGVLKYHRTLGTTLNTLIDAGFELCRVDEFGLTREQIEQAAPNWRKSWNGLCCSQSPRERQERVKCCDVYS